MYGLTQALKRSLLPSPFVQSNLPPLPPSSSSTSQKVTPVSAPPSLLLAGNFGSLKVRGRSGGAGSGLSRTRWRSRCGIRWRGICRWSWVIWSWWYFQIRIGRILGRRLGIGICGDRFSSSQPNCPREPWYQASQIALEVQTLLFQKISSVKYLSYSLIMASFADSSIWIEGWTVQVACWGKAFAFLGIPKG